MVLPEEPLIYSVKYAVGKRQYPEDVFRNKRFGSMLKCYFQAMRNKKTPLVLIITFFVNPPKSAKVSAKQMKSETMPAAQSYELCDYLLSFLEMIYYKILYSYKTLVKIDMMKFYSNNPRTVFKFMKWENYVMLQNNHSLHTKTKGICPLDEEGLLQSECQGHVKNEKLHQKSIDEFSRTYPVERSVASDSAISSTITEMPTRRKKKTAKLPSSREEARRGQSRKISE